MQSPLLYLLMLLAALPAEDRSSKTLVADFQQLAKPAQDAFLHDWLVKRFDTAARIALDAPTREAQSQRFAQVLKRVEAGKSLSADGVSRLLLEVNAAERTAIEQLSLRYRVQVYSRFRTNRTEYERRMATWRKMMAEWEAADTRVADSNQVIAWLNTSLDRMRYDEAAKLPPLPRFGAEEAAPRIVRQTPAPAGHSETLPEAVPHRAPSARDTHNPFRVSPPSLVTRQPARTTPSHPTHIAEPRVAHRVEKPPIPEIAPPPRTASREVRPIVSMPENPPSPAPDAPEVVESEPRVKIDLDELSARLHGYRLALGELTANLQEDTGWTNERLAEALTELSDLADRGAQMTLYRDLLSGDEQKQVGELPSLDAPIALLGSHIFAAREHLAESETEDSVAVAELDTLSRKLALLAAKRAK